MKTQKQNEPQLSAEMEKRFDACLEGICYISSGANKYGSWKKYSQDDDGIEYDITSEIENLKTLLATALEEQRAEYLRIIDDNIRIEKMSHRVGAHSDDYGGESDYPCNCDKVEREHRVSALESVKKRLSILTKKEQ